MNVRLELVFAVLSVALVFVAVVAARRYRFRRANNWKKLGETLRRAKIKQSPFVSPSGPLRPGPSRDVGSEADRPGKTFHGSQGGRPDDREP